MSFASIPVLGLVIGAPAVLALVLLAGAARSGLRSQRSRDPAEARHRLRRDFWGYD